jgi:transposase-like protein
MDEKQTHLTKCCPHCKSTYFKRVREYKGKYKNDLVSIHYLCIKCKKTFNVLGSKEVRNPHAPLKVLGKVLKEKKKRQELQNSI